MTENSNLIQPETNRDYIQTSDKIVLGRYLHEWVKRYLKSRGFGLHYTKFDPDFPLSARTVSAFKDGKVTIDSIIALQNIGLEIKVVYFMPQIEQTKTDTDGE